MSWVQRTLKSSVGLKMVMALSGLFLFLFLVAHLAGNLITFAGEEKFNDYAAGMQALGPLLWVGRCGLLAVFLVHIVAAVKLSSKNMAARPQAYTSKKYTKATYASRTMPMTGLITLCFVVFHLAHYTLHLVDPSFAHMLDAADRHNAYAMVVTGFSNPFMSGLYIIGMLLIGLHLSHGLSSLFQSLGLHHVNFMPGIRCVAPMIAWLLALAFISIPVAVMAGVIRLTEGVNG